MTKIPLKTLNEIKKKKNLKLLFILKVLGILDQLKSFELV